jgi:hypothetical protein
MPIPNDQIETVEIIMYGQMQAGGSNVINTVNVYHYRRTTKTNIFTKGALSSAWQSSMSPLFTALSARWIQLHNTIRIVNDATDPPVLFPYANPGMQVGDSMPAINTVFLLLKTALKGKNFRGSKKFGPIAEGDTTAPADDVLNAAALLRWQAVANVLLTPFNDGNNNLWQSVVLSRTLSQLKVNPTTVVINDISSILVKKTLGRLRKREPKAVY